MNTAAPAGLPQAFFLPAAPGARAGGERFCLYHPARGPAPRGSVLYLHPFAEELNNSRRLVARQAQALAAQGFAVLQIDLFGCGDSSGLFEEAHWDDWLADARLAQGWLATQANGPLWIWGLRSGALLAAALAALPCPHDAPATQLLLWQPVGSGEQALQQFLRLHTAGQWLDSGPAAGDSAATHLRNGDSVDIAGYTLSPALAEGLRSARLAPPVSAAPGRLVWLETTSQVAPSLTPATERQLASWRSAGWSVHAAAVQGAAFWQQVGNHEAPELMAATAAALMKGGSS